MTLVLPPCPASLKQIQHYLKTASEHETRDPVVTYWCRLYALQAALKIDKKSDEAKTLLVKLMDWLEMEKKSLSNNEAVTNDIAAQAHVENYALKLFMWADGQDRAGIFNKNIVKAFYTAGVLMDILSIFGEVNEDIAGNCKYAKWKAAYIHNCLKSGETPVPGPIGMNEGENEGVPGFAEAPGDSDNNNVRMDDPGPPSYSNIVGFKDPNPVQPNLPASVESPQPIPQNISAFTPSSDSTSSNGGLIASVSGIKLDPSQISKAQKYCKFAGSALNYDDVTDAINYLHKALKLLETGEDS